MHSHDHIHTWNKPIIHRVAKEYTTRISLIYIFFIKATGCPTPQLPQDGYMSYRNSTHAEFWCCIRHVYPDTMERVRTLKCKYQLYWDKSLADCVGEFRVGFASKNFNSVQRRVQNNKKVVSRPMWHWSLEKPNKTLN